MPLAMIAGPSKGLLLPTGSIVMNHYTGSLASARSLDLTQIGPPSYRWDFACLDESKGDSRTRASKPALAAKTTPG